MPSPVKAIPDGYHTATPYLIIQGAAQAIEFYKRAFGATELMRLAQPDGKIGHAEIKIGKGMVMLADESPEMGHKSPQTVGGTPITLMFYLPDVDANSPRRSPPERSSSIRSRTSSTATAAVRSPIRPDTSGRSRLIPKTCRPRRWIDA